MAILQDLPGPKLRIGSCATASSSSSPATVTFVCGSTTGGRRRKLFMTLPGPGLDAIDPDEIMYLADGAVRLRVPTCEPSDGEFDAWSRSAAVASRQGLNIPGETATLPAVPEEDLELLRIGESIGVDMVALSFVRRAEDVDGGAQRTRLPLIAKIEKPQAVERAEAIVRAADCVMVARGDLGVELPIEEVPIVQKRVIALAGALARRSITATQMLDSMVASSRPTRAEVTDVANAILDGTDAVMLSQETAVGQYPVEAVAMMASDRRYAPRRRAVPATGTRGACGATERDPAYTLAYNACAAGAELGLAALVVPDAVGALGAADLRPPPDGADLRAVAGTRDRAPLRADVGRHGRVDPPVRESPRS